MTKRRGRSRREERIVEHILDEVCLEFALARRELCGERKNHDNFLQLMAIGLARDLSRLKKSEIARVFRVSKRRVRETPAKLTKYYRHIPGFRSAYEKIRRRTILAIDGL